MKTVIDLTPRCERCGRVFESNRQYLVAGGLRCRARMECVARWRKAATEAAARDAGRGESE